MRYTLQGMSRRCVVDRVCCWLLLCSCCAAAAASAVLLLLLLLCCCLAAAVLLLSCCCAAAVVTYGYLFSVLLKRSCFAMPVDRIFWWSDELKK